MRFRLSRPNAIFWGCYFIALLWCFRYAVDDPSSIFYRPDVALRQYHSLKRTLEVDEYLSDITNSKKPVLTNPNEQNNEYLCVGIPSINRNSSEFLARTLGSLTDTLTPEERATVHIVVLLADRVPRAHFAYGESWLDRLADDVIVYDGEEEEGDEEKYAEKNEPEDAYRVTKWDVLGKGRSDERVQNMRFDHSVLVDACRQRKGGPYFALIEDDVIASRDWFKRLSVAVQTIELEAKEHGREWLYLRLFYSEFFMGWNAEETVGYIKYIVGLYVVLVIIFIITLYRRRRRRRRRGTKSYKSHSTLTLHYHIALALGLWLPACIALFFLAGRITWHRLLLWYSPFFNPAPHGVREMPRYGCCAQGMVFPFRQLDGFQRLLREPPYVFPGDMMLEGYAGDKGFAKWALDPSVLQHVGITESSDGSRRAEVWNFSFERMW